MLPILQDTMDNLALRELLKAITICVAIGLVVAYCLFDRKGLRTKPWLMGLVLGIVSIASVASYLEYGWLRYDSYSNPHDFYHYYMASKYADELGYYGLYTATLVADQELGSLYSRQNTIRNLRNHRYTTVQTVLRNDVVYKELFSNERWAEFKKDVQHFRDKVPRAKWNSMLKDKGYNGTPVWTMTASQLSKRIPTDSKLGMNLLVALDLALIALMTVFVWCAFGPRVAFLSTVFFGTNFVMGFVHIKGGFLRLDWLAGLLVAVSLLKMERFKLAGFVMAYPIMARIFPAIFVAGLVAKLLWNTLDHKRIDRRYIGFFITLALGATLLFGASLATTGGLDTWKEFAQKIRLHNEDISTTRVGFKYIALWPYDSAGEKAQGFEDQRVTWWFIQAIVLIATFFAVRRYRAHEALAFGFVPMFFLTAPTFYYYVVLVVPLLLFLPNLKSIGSALGAILFFSFSLTGFILHRYYALGFPFSFLLSCLLLLVAVYMVAHGLATGFRARPTDPSPDGEVAIPAPRVGCAVAFTALLVALGTGIVWNVTRAVETRAQPGVEVVDELPPGQASLVFVGDVMFSRNVARRVERMGRDYTFLFEPVGSYLRAADIAFCNLETSVSERGDAIEKRYVFRSAPKSLEGLAYAGFDIVSLANNHLLDYGSIALNDTIQHLGAHAIQSVGIVDRGEAQTPVIIESKGIRVGYLAYADHRTRYAYAQEFDAFETGPAKAVKAQIAEDIEALKAKADIIVVSLHWGVEYELEPNELQQELGQFLIDRGAAIVAGHHPHVQQEPQWYNGGLILYSMGNFIFDQHTHPATRLSRLYRVTVSKEGVIDASYLPLTIQRNDWRPLPNRATFVPVLPLEPSVTTRQR